MYGRPEYVLNQLLNEIFEMPALQGQPDHKLSAFAVKVKNYVASAKSLKMDSDLLASYPLERMVLKLQKFDQKEWQKVKLADRWADIERFSSFLTERVKLLGPLAMKQPDSASYESRGRTGKTNGRLSAHREIPAEPENCGICQGRHETAKCTRFVNVKGNPEALMRLAKQHRLCLMCLNTSEHPWHDCPSKARCSQRGCFRYHHKLIHEADSYQAVQHTRQGVANPAVRRPEAPPKARGAPRVDPSRNAHRRADSAEAQVAQHQAGSDHEGDRQDDSEDDEANHVQVHSPNLRRFQQAPLCLRSCP